MNWASVLILSSSPVQARMLVEKGVSTYHKFSEGLMIFGFVKQLWPHFQENGWTWNGWSDGHACKIPKKYFPVTCPFLRMLLTSNHASRIPYVGNVDLQWEKSGVSSWNEDSVKIQARSMSGLWFSDSPSQVRPCLLIFPENQYRCAATGVHRPAICFSNSLRFLLELCLGSVDIRVLNANKTIAHLTAKQAWATLSHCWSVTWTHTHTHTCLITVGFLALCTDYIFMEDVWT